MSGPKVIPGPWPGSEAAAVPGRVAELEEAARRRAERERDGAAAAATRRALVALGVLHPGRAGGPSDGGGGAA